MPWDPALQCTKLTSPARNVEVLIKQEGELRSGLPIMWAQHMEMFLLGIATHWDDQYVFFTGLEDRKFCGEKKYCCWGPAVTAHHVAVAMDISQVNYVGWLHEPSWRNG